MEATAEKQPRERREKIWWVGRDSLLPIFQGRVEIQGFPPDARILAVTADWYRQSIGIIVASETFEPVPDGAHLPDFEDRQNVRYVAVAEPSFTIGGVNDPGEFLNAFAMVEQLVAEHFLGEKMPAWELLKSLLQPVCFYVKEGTERLERPDGTVKFREFF